MGVIAIYRELGSGERQIVAFHYMGDVCGLAEDGRYVNTAETLTPVRATKFRFGRLADLLANHPTLDLHLLVKAAHDLRSAQRQIVILGRHRADDRVATMIALLIQGGTFFDRATHTLFLPMGRQQIADYLKLTPETLARSFLRLEAHGFMKRLSPSKIQIRNEVFFLRWLNML
ncbi:MAG: helix-turn-helix domain-containing protein, partial [Alphaproteobacteria bacterium]